MYTHVYVYMHINRVKSQQSIQRGGLQIAPDYVTTFFQEILKVIFLEILKTPREGKKFCISAFQN